jgi:4-hydroxythreonine-4-phosphate dehydrogenase
MAGIDWSDPAITLVDLGNIDPALIPRGEMSALSDCLTGDTLKHLIDLAGADELDAICFASLNKAALHLGGWKQHDEHQMFATLEKKVFFGEKNVIKEFATCRVTLQISLRQAIDLISPERIALAVGLAHNTLRANGVENPRIAVAALNPHCGKGGLFGDEEITIIRPSVEKLQAQGINCSGPVSSDAIFLKALKGEDDGVVMKYHDQGQIATKLFGFNKGVTVTPGSALSSRRRRMAGLSTSSVRARPTPARWNKRYASRPAWPLPGDPELDSCQHRNF